MQSCWDGAFSIGKQEGHPQQELQNALFPKGIPYLDDDEKKFHPTAPEENISGS